MKAPQVESEEPPVEGDALEAPPRPFKLTEAPVLWVMLLATIVALIFSVLSWACSTVGL
jgi:hypothetical protein